jgi:hypothetical protein
MVPNTSVPFDADEPLNVQAKASGADALVTLSEIKPGTAAPTAMFALTAIALLAEHSAVKTPSVIPFDGTLMVPLTVFTLLSILSVGLHARLN